MTNDVPAQRSVAAALEEVVDRFAVSHGHLSAPEHAHDRCVESSEAFVQACLAAGVRAQVVTGAKFGTIPELGPVRLLLQGHSAALVTEGDMDLVYDWTARQFDPIADFPTIMPLVQWRHDWTHPDNW